MGGDIMYPLLGLSTEYSLLTSSIRVNDIVSYCKEHNIHTVGLLDDNLYGVMEFYDACTSNDIKPLIGLKLLLSNVTIYLYAKNYQGYVNLLSISINSSYTKENLIDDLKNKDIFLVIPFTYLTTYQDILSLDNVYISYKTNSEKVSALYILIESY